MLSRFNPDFVKLKFTDPDDTRIHAAVNYVKGEASTQPAFAPYLAALKDTKITENDATNVFVEVVNKIVNRLHERSVEAFFLTTAKAGGIKPNPALRHFDDHGHTVRTGGGHDLMKIGTRCSRMFPC